MQIANNENHSICKDCGGTCCAKSPGLALPSDFGFRDPLFLEALSSGRWRIDQKSTGLRPATKYEMSDHPGVNGYYRGGNCNFLTENGCELKFENRPFECRLLIPVGEKECHAYNIKIRQFKRLWKEHQLQIEKLRKALA